MNAASLLEVLNVPVAVPASSAQVPVQPSQAFKDSLVVACQASDAVDPKLPVSKSTATDLPSLVLPQPATTPVQPAEPQPLAQTVTTQGLPVQPGQAQPAVPLAPLVAAFKPAIVRPAVANPHSRPSSHLSEATSILAPVAHVLQSVPEQAVAVVSLPQNETGVALLVPPLNTVASAPATSVTAKTSITTTAPPVKLAPIPTLSAVASPSVNVVPIPTPVSAASPSVSAVPTPAITAATSQPLLPAASSSANPVPIPSNRAASPPASSAPALDPAVLSKPEVSAPSTVASTATATVTVAKPQPPSVAASASITPAAQVPMTDASLSAPPTPLPSAAPAVALPEAVKPAVVAQPLEPVTVTKTMPRGVSDAIPQPAPAPLSSVAKNSGSPVVARANAFVPPAPVAAPVVHDAVTPAANRETTAKASPVLAIQPTTHVEATAASPSPDTGASSPAAPVHPLVASTQPSTQLPTQPSTQPPIQSSIQPSTQLPTQPPIQPSIVTVQETVPVVITANIKDGAVKPVNDATGSKQHVPAVSDQNGSQARSQATSQAGDQNQSSGQGSGQGGPSQQGQSTAPTPAPANLVNHTVTATVDNAQSVAAAVPQSAAPLALPADHAKAPATPASTVSALPQPLPVVNTAKLIQTAGQTEMRVGMRSSDFGNISISTSSTRDVISTQISLDHSELAKTLATHVPEMQARLGGNQAMDVRIDMNGQATGQGGATSSGMSTASGDQSRGDQPSRGNNAPAPQNETVSVTATTAAAPLSEAAMNSRLDIRV